MKQYSRLKAGIGLSLTLYGMFLCLEEVLITGISRIALLALAVFFLVFTELMYLGKKWKWALALLFAAVLAWASYLNQEILLEGGKEIANRVLSLINQYYRTEYLLWFVRPKGAEKIWCFTLLCLLLGFAECFLAVTVSSRNFKSVNRASRRTRFAFLCIPVLILILESYLGKSPSVTGMLLISAGFLAAILDLGEKGTWIPAAGVTVILVLAAFFAGSGPAGQIIGSRHPSWYHWQLKREDQLMELADKISGIPLFSGNKAKREYLLDNDKPKQTGEELFQITVEKRPEQTVYIRGFIGGDYEGGSWSAASPQEFSDWAQSQGFSNQECRETVQNYPYWKLKEGDGSGQDSLSRHVTIQLQSPVSGYTLSPYYTEIPEQQPAEGDGMLSPLGETEFQWDSFLFLRDWQREGFYSLYEWEQRVSVPDLSGRTREEEIWEAYGDYARQTYTRLPGEGLEKLRELADSYDQLNLWAAEPEAEFFSAEENLVEENSVEENSVGESLVEENSEEESLVEENSAEENLVEENSAEENLAEENSAEENLVEENSAEEAQGADLYLWKEAKRQEYRIVQTTMLLWSTTEYSQNLKPVPEGADFAEYFLLEQKRGFCVHYATAGTLILRMLGIPARYVSGYVVFPEDFKENPDGTFTAEVKDYQGHAWTEVFQESTGFFPQEMTPPSYLNVLQRLEPGEDVEEALRELEQDEEGKEETQKEQTPAPERPEEEERVHTPAVEEDPGEAADAEKNKNSGNRDADRNTDRDFGISQSAAGILLCLAGAALIFGLFWQVRRYRQKKQRAEIYQENRGKGVLAMGKAMEKLLESKGLARKKNMGDQEYAAFLAQKLPEFDWERIIWIWQKAAFSGEGVTEEEFQSAEKCYQELTRKLRK